MLCIRESGRGGALRVWADGEKVVFFKNRHTYVMFKGMLWDKMRTNVRIFEKSWQKRLDKRKSCAIMVA